MKLPELKLRLKKAEKELADYRASGDDNLFLFLGLTNLIWLYEKRIEETDKEK